MRVTGSELVGLLPLESLLAAGRYFLHKQQRSSGVSDSELIKIAVKSMGLDQLAPFDPQKNVIEYAMQASGAKKLVNLTVKGFVEETASESPAPGGGSGAAAMVSSPRWPSTRRVDMRRAMLSRSWSPTTTWSTRARASTM